MAGKKKSAPAQKYPETREEWIAHFTAQTRDIPEILPEPTVRLEVGMEVDIGSLEDCRIEGFCEGGRMVITSSLTRKTRDNNPEPGDRTYQKWAWWDVFPKAQATDTRFGKVTRVVHQYVSSDVGSLLHGCMHFGVDDDPDFQRGYVWTLDDRERLLESVFAQRDIGKIIFVKRPFPANKWVLDGKQRLSALLDFRLGKYPYKGVYYYQLSARDRRIFDDLRMQHMELNEQFTTRLDMLELFLELNTSGVPVAEEHIASVRKLYADELAKGAE